MNISLIQLLVAFHFLHNYAISKSPLGVGRPVFKRSFLGVSQTDYGHRLAKRAGPVVLGEEGKAVKESSDLRELLGLEGNKEPGCPSELKASSKTTQDDEMVRHLLVDQSPKTSPDEKIDEVYQRKEEPLVNSGDHSKGFGEMETAAFKKEVHIGHSPDDQTKKTGQAVPENQKDVKSSEEKLKASNLQVKEENQGARQRFEEPGKTESKQAHDSKNGQVEENSGDVPNQGTPSNPKASKWSKEKFNPIWDQVKSLWSYFSKNVKSIWNSLLKKIHKYRANSSPKTTVE